MDRDSVAIIAPGGHSYSSSNLDPQERRSRTLSTTSEHDVTVTSKPLLKLKLLDSLRQGDFKQLDALVRKEFQPVGDPNVEEVKNLMLHYAVQVAPTSLIKEIVHEWSVASPTSRTGEDSTAINIDINYRDQNGDTPLHLSAFQSRADVVGFLMDQPDINDCILNNSHLQPIEMCRNLSIAQMMQTKRATYVAEIAQEFRTAFNNRDFGHLEAILSNPRNAELLDINGMDPETGDTVLHEFVKKRDVIMCRWLLEHGADPFNRDREGRLPIDLVGKVSENDSATSTKVAIDIELKKLLGKAAKEQSVIDVTNNLHEPPVHKGYLKKWTNFAQGYKLRWFILSSDGKLSYYKDQADTRNACRGSLNMSTCYLHLDSSEKLKFEIIGGSNGAIRWHLKANHPIETNRWVWAIQGAIRFAKDRELLMKSGTVPPSLAMNRNLNTGNKHESPLYSSQLQHNQGSRRASGHLDEEFGVSDSFPQHGRPPSSIANRQRMSTTSLGSSELRLNDNLTESGKLYVSRMVGNRIESGSHYSRSRTNSNLSHHHSSQKSGVNALVGGFVDQEGNSHINNHQSQPGVIQSDSRQQEHFPEGVIGPQTKKSPSVETPPDLGHSPTTEATPPVEDAARNYTPKDATAEISNDDDLDNASSDDGEDHRDQNSNFDIDDQDVKTQFGPYSQRLLMIQRSLSMELSSLNELLNSGHGNEEIWATLRKSLPSLSNTFEKLYFLTSERDKRLGAMLTKQREVNNVWIQSVKDLELELIEKSNRLASLDKERRGLKRLLHKKLAEAGASPDGSQFNTIQPRPTEESNATLEGIAKFIEATKEEDEDSDADIFFDAEDLVDSESEDEDATSERQPQESPDSSAHTTVNMHSESAEAPAPDSRDSHPARVEAKQSDNSETDTPGTKEFSVSKPPSRAPPRVPTGSNARACLPNRFSIHEPPSSAPPPIPGSANHFGEEVQAQKTHEQERPEIQSFPHQTRTASLTNHGRNPFRDSEAPSANRHSSYLPTKGTSSTPQGNNEVLKDNGNHAKFHLQRDSSTGDFVRQDNKEYESPSKSPGTLTSPLTNGYVDKKKPEVHDGNSSEGTTSKRSSEEFRRNNYHQEPQTLNNHGKRHSRGSAATAGTTTESPAKSNRTQEPNKETGTESAYTQGSKNRPNSISKGEQKSLPIQGSTELQKQKSAIILKEGSFLGYEDGLRKKLKLEEDDRPAISLWSVLKSMVGKDMTRMTLPVTFNEPTSLLQRVAEDLEYTDILDTACGFDDSTLRLLYVSIFTASSYASTIKRVAKPFNPLLGETYEYSRPDKGFRFFTEQVSHHPVISATWTESAKWDFWGESNVETRFNGRSFGIKHLGLWHIKMRPDNGSPEELYTWKKPDNTVIGILVGNPQVDNHGEVEVRNHTTGDRCLINFKARGWRSQGAYEVTGEVFNKKNEKKWVLGGHWNEAIYAKLHTSKNKSDIMKTQDASSNGPKLDGSKFLVWKAASRPDAPFHLTPFAITLNAPQRSLLPWLAPTDTRLRPDQRDMEEGLYDEAGDEKHRLEEKQRAVRRRRAEKNETYKPLWFQKEVHPVTKTEFWKFNGEYWKLRKDHKLKDVSPDIF